MTPPRRDLRAPFRVATLSLGLLLAGADRAAAELVSEGSGFGPNTITHDTVSDLRWLDLTLSVDLSYSEILAALGPAGSFEGFRLGSGDEVATLWENAGVDVGTGLFVPQNYDPIVALTNLVGQTGDNGNCGEGCTFNFTAGWIDNGSPAPDFISYATVSWFDNSAPLSPSYPQAPIGRGLFSTTTSDTGSATRGAWLVAAPEPVPTALGATAGLALCVLAARRQRAR